jgi:hypothetical protein
MTDELIAKIQRLLHRKFTNETKVVYLLVELRKLMDREAYCDPVLRTFSNWVVHTCLENRAEGSTLILTEFDEFMADIYQRQRVGSHPKHLSFGTFRDSLIECFNHFGLKAEFVNDPAEWKRFSRHYCAIVSECPIVFSASKIKLKYIQKVELTRVSGGLLIKEWPMVHWRLTFIDGNTQNWGFHMG